MRIVETLKNIFRIPDLRNRIWFTLAALAVYRLGRHVPTPGVDTTALTAFFEQSRGQWFGLADMFSGGNLSRVTIFALGIMPYISASIILQLLTIVWPYLDRLSKEGELGRKKITELTRYLTVVLSIVESGAVAAFLQNPDATGGLALVAQPGIGFTLTTISTLTAGAMFVMWLGEQITERGIGNGMSLLIFAGIVVGVPQGVMSTLRNISSGEQSLLVTALLVAFMLAVMACVVLVERAERRIAIHTASRHRGRHGSSTHSTHLPLKINMAGVMPVIFASSLIALPTAFASLLPDTPWMRELTRQIAWGMPLYTLFYVSGIVFFCYFYTAIIFNTDDVADNMRKYGRYLPGIRPGARTAMYLDRIVVRLTFGGALYLAAVAVLPEFLIRGLRVAALPVIGPWLDSILPAVVTNGLGLTFFFGGTSLLIVVSVAMDTALQIESRLIMRHYDGFTRGRRSRQPRV